MKTVKDMSAYCDKFDDLINFSVNIISKDGLGTTGHAVDSVVCPLHTDMICNYYATCSTVQEVSKQMLQEIKERM